MTKLRSLSKWGLLYIWENSINAILKEFDLSFDGVICIRKVPNCLTHYYIAYINVKKNPDIEPVTYVQINIKFIKNRPYMDGEFLWYIYDIGLFSQFKEEELILDNRRQFYLIESSGRVRAK
jgi:hypothetical protein